MINCVKPCLSDGSLADKSQEWSQAKGYESHKKYLSSVNIYTIKCSECGFVSWHEAALEVWIPVTRFDDGVNYHLNSNHLLWWDHSCMILKAVSLSPPLSIWHALAHRHAHIWLSCSTTLNTDLDIRLKPCHHYRSSPSLTLAELC